MALASGRSAQAKANPERAGNSSEGVWCVSRAQSGRVGPQATPSDAGEGAGDGKQPARPHGSSGTDCRGGTRSGDSAFGAERPGKPYRQAQVAKAVQGHSPRLGSGSTADLTALL